MKIRLILPEAHKKTNNARQLIKDISRKIFNDFKMHIEYGDFSEFDEEIGPSSIDVTDSFEMHELLKGNEELKKKLKNVNSHLEFIVKYKFEFKKTDEIGFIIKEANVGYRKGYAKLNLNMSVEILDSLEETREQFRLIYDWVKSRIYLFIVHEVQHMIQKSIWSAGKNQSDEYEYSIPIKKILPVTYSVDEMSDYEKYIIENYVLGPYQGGIIHVFNITEIEAYAKDIYNDYKFEKKKERDIPKDIPWRGTSIEWHIIENIEELNLISDLDINLKICFFVFVLRYIYNTYPNSNINYSSLDDFDTYIEYLSIGEDNVVGIGF